MFLSVVHVGHRLVLLQLGIADNPKEWSKVRPPYQEVCTVGGLLKSIL
jgi:hypothetical protein